MIEDYSFGRMVINGKTYSADLIIYPDGRIQESWWRLEGHRLQLADLEKLLRAEPEIIVAGTGASGMMKPAAGLTALLKEQGIELICQPTATACGTFNELLQHNKKGAGCFHLTC
ncbi:hypothetical protein BMS3Bbin14_00098 [bacterium BMS3Bbin14]|nr:hypothetical protein BMS3Abin13_00577 [bacterium BMS3Abin13]GBE51644.1 hypothetical protein BMS3Bbin14_00098 [bacterium BMS3Bbin14]HDK44450.1 hypothetical protein [Desulfobacteraceae bacterium]HDO31343.1 hypothetical protein [Desulfobacteraceae bacterium]